nr:glycosyltransferase [Candidatus Aenigmarchaeota archaeon]
MAKIRVAHIITMLELGGAQQNTIYTVEHLDRDRYEPILISGPGGILDREVGNNPRIRCFFIRHLVRPISPLRDTLALISLYRLLKSKEVGLVHTHSSKAGILGRWAAHFARVPRIMHTYHGFGFNDYQNWWVRKLLIWLERVTARVTDKLVAVSGENIKKGLANGIGEEQQYTVIHSGIKNRAFSEINIDIDEKRREIGVEKNESVIGMIACFKPQKAPLNFIRLAERVCSIYSRARFVLVGDGELRPKIEKLIAELNLEKQVILTGWRRDIPQLIHIFDVLVLTSIWEGLPRVFLEAWACGKPVVATNVDGAREAIIDGKNGFL